MKILSKRQATVLKRVMQYAMEDQLELAYEALLDFSREYDETRFSSFGFGIVKSNPKKLRFLMLLHVQH